MWVGIRVSIASIIILADLVMLIIWLCSKDDIKKSSPGRRPLFLHAAVVTNTLLDYREFISYICKAYKGTVPIPGCSSSYSISSTSTSFVEQRVTQAASA
uniref:Uncharacterized protein n=1 Tax=Solanum lycopersicum TaxID=4081 RepID=A0A3Q7EFJ9_SOLLC